jgi:3-deoxy-manno-octulosonate cytidylyltransferase (CMP-KDO synthetase)
MDVVINIQGDQPALDGRCLSQVVSPLIEDPDLVMSTLVSRMSDPAAIEDPNCVKCVFDSHHFALYFSRSPVPFHRDGSMSSETFKHLGIYAFRKHFLKRFAVLPSGRLEIVEKLEQLRAMEQGYRIKVVETDFDSKAVDVPEDLKRVEALLERERSR